MAPNHDPVIDRSFPARCSYVWLAIAGCLCALLLSGFLVRTAFLESEKRAEMVAGDAAELLAADLKSSLRRLQAGLEEIAAQVPPEAMRFDSIARFAETLNRNLLLHTRHFPEVLGYRITDRAGALLYSSESGGSRASAQGRSYFEELKADPRKTLVFSEVSLGSPASGPMLHAAVPIRGTDGQFNGTVVALIDLDSLQRRFDAIRHGKLGTVSLRRSDDARLMLHSPAWPETMNKVLPADPVFQHVGSSDGRGLARLPVGDDGIKRIYAYRRAGHYPFYISVGIAEDDYLAAWRFVAALALLGCAGILSVLGLVTWRLGRLEIKETQLTARCLRREATCRAVLEAAPFQIVISGVDDGCVKYINRRAAKWLNAEPEEILGQSCGKLFRDPESHHRIVSILMQEGVVRDLEIELRQRNGGRRWAMVSMELVEFDGVPCALAACSDISERLAAELAAAEAEEKLQAQVEENRRLQAALKEQAIRDGLTGLFNRRYLDETLEQEVARARRENGALSLVILDIDHFKQINDCHGHQAGDLVLKTIATRLAAEVRAEDVACRYGGKEFLVLLPNTPFETAIDRANEWCRSLAEIRFAFDGTSLGVTASFGVASYPDHARTSAHLAQSADRALDMAKRNGWNRIAACLAAGSAGGRTGYPAPVHRVL